MVSYYFDGEPASSLQCSTPSSPMTRPWPRSTSREGHRPASASRALVDEAHGWVGRGLRLAAAPPARDVGGGAAPPSRPVLPLVLEDEAQWLESRDGPATGRSGTSGVAQLLSAASTARHPGHHRPGRQPRQPLSGYLAEDRVVGHRVASLTTSRLFAGFNWSDAGMEHIRPSARRLAGACSSAPLADVLRTRSWLRARVGRGGQHQLDADRPGPGRPAARPNRSSGRAPGRSRRVLAPLRPPGLVGCAVHDRPPHAVACVPARVRVAASTVPPGRRLSTTSTADVSSSTSIGRRATRMPVDDLVVDRRTSPVRSN